MYSHMHKNMHINTQPCTQTQSHISITYARCCVNVPVDYCRTWTVKLVLLAVSPTDSLLINFPIVNSHSCEIQALGNCRLHENPCYQKRLEFSSASTHPPIPGSACVLFIDMQRNSKYGFQAKMCSYSSISSYHEHVYSHSVIYWYVI